MTRYLTPQQVLFIHARLIATTGGEPGILNLGLLESAVARPQATFDGADLYPDLLLKTAALMESLTQNHPFIDGNKRRLQTTNAEMERFTMRVVGERPSLDAIAKWFKANSRD